MASSCALINKSSVIERGSQIQERSKLAAKKKVVKRAWSAEDHRVLKSLARQKLGVAKISKKLKRTAGATAAQASKAGISLSMRG